MRGRYFATLFSVCAILFPGIARSQNPGADPASAYNEIVRAIQQEQWDKGLNVVNSILKTWGDRGKKQFGPVFGHFYFVRGILQIGKKNYAGAAESFRICYEDYPNDTESLKNFPGDDRNKALNRFRYHALEQWAGVLMVQEKWGEARDKYEKVLKEGKDSGVNRIQVAVNLGRCYLKAGDLEKGFNYISPVLESDAASTGLKQTIFMILAEDWSTEVEFAKIQNFLAAHRHVVDEDLLERRHDRNPRFQYLAQLGLRENEPLRALSWYSLMAHPGKLKTDYELRLKDLEENSIAEPEQKEAIRQRIGEEVTKLEKEYLALLNGVGTAHFQMRNFAASFTSFRHLAGMAPADYEPRPVVLHNVVASGAQIGEWRDVYKWGLVFLKDYPDHELKPAVARMMVEVIFLQGQYQEAYTIGKDVRQDMEPGSDIRDIPDFIVGASAFHLDKFEEADRELDAYLENYPQAKRHEPALFYSGSAKVKLFKWEDGGRVLDEFLKKYPNSEMVPGALYQNGLCKFMLDDLETALALTIRLLEEFASAPEIPAAWNLKGDILVSLEEATFEEIEETYLTGKNRSNDIPGQEETAAYSLWQLVSNCHEVELWEKLGGYYDEFQQNHADSVFRLEMLAAALQGLAELGRAEEGLAYLRGVLREFGDQPESEELPLMFGTYLDFLKESLPPEEALAELDQLLVQPKLPRALEGWLRVGKVDILQAMGEEVPQDRINQEFYALQVNFDPASHSNYVIVQLARWMTEYRKKADEAKPYYEFILENRPGTTDYQFALLDTAEIDAKSDDPEVRAQAMARFQRVLREVLDDEIQESATLGIARLLTDDKKWEEARTWWEKYLEKRSWAKARPEANYKLAHCMDELGQTSEALKIYVSVYANFPGHLDWSTRAYLRTALIIKESGEELKALLVLRDMIQRMGHLEHPGVTQGKELFVKWRESYQPESTQEKGKS